MVTAMAAESVTSESALTRGKQSQSQQLTVISNVWYDVVGALCWLWVSVHDPASYGCEERKKAGSSII